MKESHFWLKSPTPPVLRLTMRSYKVWHVTVVCEMYPGGYLDSVKALGVILMLKGREH